MELLLKEESSVKGPGYEWTLKIYVIIYNVKDALFTIKSKVKGTRSVYGL